MSNLEKSKELLKRYSIARIPFIAINTIERSRTLDILKEVSNELSLSFYVHTLSKGVYDISNENIVCDDKSIYGAIDFMSEQMKRRQYLTLVLTEVPDLSSDNADSRHIKDLVTLANETGGVVIVLTNNSIWNQLQRLGMTIKIDMPDEDEMYLIIKEYIDDYRNNIDIEWDDNNIREVASILAGVTRIEAENVIAALIANKSIKKSDIDEIRFAKDKLFSDISGLERIEVDDSVKDVGGLSGLKRWLDEKKSLLTPNKRAILKKKGLQPPRGILLVGVPGCGKSLSAKSISANWKLPLYRLDFATVQGSFVGQTEQQLKDALTTAENVSPCILWIDEIEKGLSGAGSSNDGGVSTRMVGQFLFWLQECKKQVFVVATANDVSMLPSELLRRGRFDELFFIDLPTQNEREEILRLYMRKYLNINISDEFVEKIVEISDGFTGADLESTVRDLAYRCIANDKFELTEENIINAFNNVVPLSQTSPEKIEAIRAWGKERAVPASGNPIGAEKLTNKTSNKTRRVLV
ncbi:AAA family ATPase [uncultured Megamonas sp.]|uniref:AAA family ATPase n=1 Tax=uncultured Megamonas sp. TaxID=286140 RepID=UPI002597D459|nr:AAA family ATPase [uncultured Megamonas sp.]